MSDYLGKDVFKLGFGLMRLPKLSDGKSIDIEQTSKMVDLFIKGGGTYFDTAYVYDDGRSEEAIREALVKRYPRESYTLCTKLCAWQQCHDEESAKQEFYTSLERTGAEYFDYYLLHALMTDNYKKYDEYHLWDFVKEQKKKGLIKHFGFSYHSDPKLLDELLTEHPEVDFVQLQINYADWDNPKVAARENYEVARRHNVPIVVMEPIKGGSLANPIPEVRDIFDKADPNVSYASWAMRYVASLDGIITVLSGMSNLEQMEDNMSYMTDFVPLSDEEQKVISLAQNALDKSGFIKCTACHYCTGDCPLQIPIPEIFSAYNEAIINNNPKQAKEMYDKAVSKEGNGKASDCVSCGQCESACPQQLPVIELIAKAAEKYDQ